MNGDSMLIVHFIVIPVLGLIAGLIAASASKAKPRKWVMALTGLGASFLGSFICSFGYSFLFGPLGSSGRRISDEYIMTSTLIVILGAALLCWLFFTLVINRTKTKKSHAK